MQPIQTYDGSYDAARAAALSGVPISTVYDWARKRVVAPSIASERPKLWSYADLMALRIVSWLRHPKDGPDDGFPASPMGAVRSALVRLGALGIDLWWPSSSQVSDGTSEGHGSTNPPSTRPIAIVGLAAMTCSSRCRS
ncbi:MAG: hypothetical protein ACRDY2_01405 [Acidimicrobiales bacterium]